MKFDTKVVRAAIKPDPATGAIITPLYQTATYVLPEVGQNLGFDYTRSSNPTRQVLEEHLAAIEGTKHGIAFSSGMAAVDSVMKLFNPGDHIISSDNIYGGVTRLFNQVLQRYKLEFTYVDSTDAENIEKAVQDNTKMIWIETPSNPLIKISDLQAIGEIAKKHSLLYGVDPTFATPAILKTIDYGVDLIVHSTTKYISGHNQLIGGIVLTSNSQLAEKLRFVQKTIGAVPSPFDSWLTLLGVKTLALRMKKHSENGLKVAKFLDKHSKVSKVYYPGLETHTNHHIAKKQMDGYGGMVAFEVKGGIFAGKTVMNTVKLCMLAESLGGVETMITHPASMTHADVPKEEREKAGIDDGLIRVSVGIENIEDIIEDLNQALAKA